MPRQEDDIEEGNVHVQLAVLPMKPGLRNFFMKKLKRERMMPTMSASLSQLIFGMTISRLPSFPRLTATVHMLLLNRPGNDSAGLQQQAAVFQNRRSE